MEKIELCDEVVFLLNTSFFESVFCMYELWLWHKSKVHGCVLKLYDMNLDDNYWLMARYKKMVRGREKLTLDQQEAMKDILDNFEDYAALIKELSSNRMRFIDEYELETATESIFTLITGKKPTKEADKETKRIVQYYVRGLDSIRNEGLQRDFQNFVYDLLRGSSFTMSPYNEDTSGEKTYELLDYKMGDGDLGAYLWLRAQNDQGKEELLTVFDINAIVRDPNYFSKNQIKYYIEIKDRNICRDIRLYGNPHGEKNPICRQRCLINYQEDNALEHGYTNNTLIINYVQN
jgi:hypothetical protein